MTRTLSLFCLALFGVLAVSADAQANGLLRRRGGGDCAPECASAAPVVAHVPAAPVYEDRKVTRYKTVTKVKDVTEVVCRMVPREEKYNFTVSVPVTRQEVRKQTVQVPVHRTVEYKYTAMVPETVKEKRTVVECVPTYRDVEYNYTVMVPRTVTRVVKQTTMQRNVKHVEEDVKVCRMVRETSVDECGRCHTVCRPVTEVVRVKRCVVECVPVTRDVEVRETVCDRVERKGVRRVCEIQRQEKQVEVAVVRCRPEERVGKRTVCEYTTEVRDVKYNVCVMERQERTGTRTVYDRTEDKVTRKVSYTECVPYEDTVRVLVSGGDCHTACDTGCGNGRRFGGLFRRCGGGCN